MPLRPAAADVHKWCNLFLLITAFSCSFITLLLSRGGSLCCCKVDPAKKQRQQRVSFAVLTQGTRSFREENSAAARNPGEKHSKINATVWPFLHHWEPFAWTIFSTSFVLRQSTKVWTGLRLIVCCWKRASLMDNDGAFKLTAE